MGLRSYFTGRSGCLFWLNVLLALVLLIGIPYAAFNSLDILTHHGEKIQVPQVMSMDGKKAIAKLEKSHLVGVVFDSIYVANKKPGIVLSQSPHAGNLVKSGRSIYLTLNRSGEPPIRVPDLIRNSTDRLAARQLENLGFTLNKTEIVYNEPKGLLLAIQQGDRKIKAGDMLHKDEPLTLGAAGGEPLLDSLGIDTSMNAIVVVETGGFNVEL